MKVTNKPKNPAAFPSEGDYHCADGMTLRDYAVVHNTAAILANTNLMESLESQVLAVLPAGGTNKDVAVLIGDMVTAVAAGYADAMLRERAK